MINTDWKKQAAQILDEKEVERAFMDQAYNFVANKAGPLMEDPHRLGFEVVYSDEDHTRMVGMFASRVNQELYYVPVFFLNGQIRGTDLLYSHDKKMFRPLNKDWATYTVEKQKNSMGSGISKRDARKMPMDLELGNIANPPGSYVYKSAADDVEGVREMFEKLANSFTASMDTDVKSLIKKYLDKKHTTDNEKPEAAKCNEVDDARVVDTPKSESEDVDDSNTKEGSILRRFILEDGGADAVEKLASWMKESKHFAELLVTNVASEDYMPKELFTQVKAATHKTPELILYVGGFEAFNKIPQTDMQKSASAQEEFFSKGYYLWDDRAPGDLNPATKDLTVEVCKPGEPGVYKILMGDGSMREVYVAAPAQQRFRENGASVYATHPDAWECSQWNKDKPRELVIVMKDGGESGTVRRVHGEFVKNLSDCIREDELDKEMSSGKTYRVFDAEAGVFSEPLYCIGKREDNDLVIYTVATNYSSKFEVRQNKDQDNTSFDANFLGRHTYFIPVSTEGKVTSKTETYDSSYAPSYRFRAKELPRVGDDKTLTNWILETGVKEASFIRDHIDPELFSLRAGPRKQTRFMPRAALAAKCARDLGVHATSIEYFLDKAAADGSARFFVGDPGVEKFASPIQLVDQEQFADDYDSQFNVGLDYPQAFALDTQTDSPHPPQQRVGDAYDPGMGMTAEDGKSLSTAAIMNAPVDQLEAMKAQSGVPNVFEHGLIGSLIHTYDSVSMIDKYVPDLETALDRLGRLLFLYYWKPRDFEDAYGADDMSDLENKLLSTFQSFGAIVLELLKKSQSQRGSQGNVSMFSS
jgi:hypothetical protein